MAVGRPSIYSEEYAKLICERVAINPVGYSTLVQMYDDMPHVATIRAWRMTKPAFSKMYREAKEFQAEIMVEEIDDLIPGGIRFYVDDKGQERIDAPSASLVIAKVNNRKWMAARLAPRLYGDKQQPEASLSASDTLNKVKQLVADLNKVNESDV
jgi:hypothetical protein